MARPDRAVIPVAGLATRMYPLSRAIPKELLPLGRKPVLSHVVEELARAGVSRLQMITSERTRAIEQYFGPDEPLDRALSQAGLDRLWAAENEIRSRCSFHFVRQEAPRGLADAVHRARPFLAGRPFFLHMGDSVISGDPDLAERMIEAQERSGAAGVVAVHTMTGEHIRAGATVVPRSDPGRDTFEIEAVIEKPAQEEIVTGLGLVGRYLLVAPLLERPRPEPRISLLGGLGGLFPDRLDGPVLAVRCRPEAQVHDAGTLDGYLQAQAFFALHDERVGPAVRALVERTQE